MPRSLLFVGSCNRGLPYVPLTHGRGISAYDVDVETGAARLLEVFEDIDNPTFLTIAPDGRSLYAASEMAGAVEGTITAFAIERATGGLTRLGARPSEGYTPAHISLDPAGALVAAANYGDVAADKRPAGEAIVVYRRDPGGALSPVIARAAHGGSGPDRSRQERPHPHCVGWTPDGRFLVVSDLGVDRLLIYRLTIGGLIAHGEVALPPGSGPRHFAFHPNGRFAYVVTEMGSTVVSFAFEAGHAGFRLLDVASTIPAGVRANTGSAIALTPDGRHVLAGNRGDDSVARLTIDAGGVARFAETTPSGGRTPRDFTFDPGGRLLAVANQNSDNVALFRYERSSGSLTPLASIGVGSPTVVAFYPDLA